MIMGHMLVRVRRGGRTDEMNVELEGRPEHVRVTIDTNRLVAVPRVERRRLRDKITWDAQYDIKVESDGPDEAK